MAEPMIQLYTILSIIMFFGLFLIILVIAGKDIYFAFKRRLMPKGSDVFVANGSKKITQYYKTPHEGQFRIDKQLYITNPQKILSLDPKMLDKEQRDLFDKSIRGVKKKKERISARIEKMKEKIALADAAIIELAQDKRNEAQIQALKYHISDLLGKIEFLKKKEEGQEEIYYHRRRPTFFYIEGDPIPKDFHEWYTELDSIMIDNVIARSQTKDPKAVRDMQKELTKMKVLIMIAIGAAAISAIVVFKLSGDLQPIIQSGALTV